MANVKVKYYERSRSKRKLPSFPPLLHCFVAFSKAESFYKMCFLWVNCMFIYGFWWESKPLIALIYIFIWFFCKKNTEQLLVWIWNLLQASQFLTRGCSVKYFIWKINCSFQSFQPARKKKKKKKRWNEMESKKPLFDSNGSEGNLNWWGKNPGWCYLWDLQPEQAEGDNLKGTSLI